MRFDSVTAQAFGPLLDLTLNFAPGMAIVYGPNESGKSSWHAALYAALCGMRRGRGRPMKEDEVFEAHHRPWDGDAWEVSAIITLDDGRRRELRQDLASKTGTARDADTGRDYTNEIIKDGAPDGAVWLGLDRRSFLSTACVKQADIQAIMNDAEALQVHMQRAAATAGSDATAAAALTAIEEFHRDNVGSSRSNSTKPLRTATVRRKDAQDRLQEARNAHENYVARLVGLEALEVNAAEAECRRRVVEAAIGLEDADEAQGNLDRARALKAKHPYNPAPEHSRQARLAQQARLALQLWDNQPEPVDLTGPAAAKLRQQLNDLPAIPEGDTEPHATVVRARDDLRHAKESLTDHLARRSTDPKPVHTGGLNLEDIRALIADLSLEVPQVDPSLQGRIDLTGPTSEELRQQLNDLPAIPEGDTEPHATVVRARDDFWHAKESLTDHLARRPTDPKPVHIGGLNLEDIRALIADLSLEEPQVDPSLQGRIDRAQARVNDFKKQKARKPSGPLAWLFRLIAVILAPFKGKRRDDDGALLRAEKELAEAKDALGKGRYRIEEARQRKKDAAAKAADNGLPDDSEELRALAAQAEEASHAERDLCSWSTQKASLGEKAEQAEQALADSLRARGVADLHPVADALAAYEAACTQRAEQFREASRRPDLKRALASRLEAETAAEQAALGEERLRIERQRRADAAAEAADNGLPDDPEELRAVAGQAEEASRAERDLRNWSNQEGSLREKAEQAEQALVDALGSRGVTDLHPAAADALATYDAACARRAEQFREASRRPDLEQALKARKGEEAAAAEAERRRNEAADALRQAGEALGIHDEDDERMAICLLDWVQDYEATAPDRQVATEEWSKLRNLLGEGGIAGLETAAEERRSAAEAAAQALDEGAISSVVLEPDSGAQLQRLRVLESECNQALNTGKGERKEAARNLPSVAEAEEELERARVEHERVTNLGDILSKTQQLLEQAQVEAHRDIAPHLVKALTPWIRKVTGGRYSTVMVDPQGLMVRASSDGGELRNAPLLSHGTTEQIYLLLRVAMACLLTRVSGETCPLLLDDVTVHCDSERQTAILNLLQEISTERQVILFSQEPETLSWAERRLQRDTERLIELDPGAIGV